jgi:hypothetical protein
LYDLHLKFLSKKSFKSGACFTTTRSGFDFRKAYFDSGRAGALPQNKTSNNIRDEIIKVFRRILPFVGMTDTGTHVESEVHNIVLSLPRLQPFDLSIRLDHSLGSGHWKTPYHCIGFNVTVIHSTKNSSATPSEAAQYNECDLRLRDGEKMKFAHPRGGTNPITNRTITPDNVIGEIIQANHAFMPIAVGPFGEFHSLFRQFIENHSTLPLC